MFSVFMTKLIIFAVFCLFDRTGPIYQPLEGSWSTWLMTVILWIMTVIFWLSKIVRTGVGARDLEMLLHLNRSIWVVVSSRMCALQCAFDLETFRLWKFVGFLPDIQMHVGLVSSDCNLRFTLWGKCFEKDKNIKLHTWTKIWRE